MRSLPRATRLHAAQACRPNLLRSNDHASGFLSQVRAGRPRSVRLLAAAVLLTVALAAAPASASPDPRALPDSRARGEAALCDAAAAAAARAEGVPLDLMRAISLAETGRSGRAGFAPWPWTVNMEGEGRWFDDPRSLLEWVRAKQRRGARSFDLGCFQVNHLWHGEAFDSLEQMLRPDDNARYAARFLRALFEETGSWETAAGLYHSRTPELAGRYRDRVLRLMADLPDAARTPPAPDAGRSLDGDAPLWFFADINPLRGRLARPRSAGGSDAAADAQAASLARAWIAGAAPSPLVGRAGSGGGAPGLLRRASPLFPRESR